MIFLEIEGIEPGLRMCLHIGVLYCVLGGDGARAFMVLHFHVRGVNSKSLYCDLNNAYLQLTSPLPSKERYVPLIGGTEMIL